MTKILFTFINLMLVSTLVAQNVGINNMDPQATLDINGDVRYRSYQLNLSGSLHNDLDLTTNKFSVYSIQNSFPTGVIITGMNGGVDGREVLFYNNSTSSPITFISDMNSLANLSQANNRILNFPNFLIYLNPGGSLKFRYDGSRMRWTPVSGTNTNGLETASDFWLLNNGHISNSNIDNVGIGVSNPLTKLHVEGTSILSNNELIDPDQFSNKIIAGRIADGSGWESIGVGGKNSNAGQVWAIGSVNGDLSIAAGNGTSENSLQTGIIVDVNRNVLLTPFGGNVGVGQNNPSQKLDINGKIRIGNDTTNPLEGTVRWNTIGKNLEVFDGESWISLTSNIWGAPNVNSVQNQIITPADNAAGDKFGFSVSVEGETAIISSPGDDIGSNIDQGSVYVFKWDGANWVQNAKLTASDGLSGDNFGTAIQINGNYIVIGAPNDQVGSNLYQGSAYVFFFNGSSWVEQYKLTASDGNAGDMFGKCVSIYLDQVSIGSPNSTSINNVNGAIYIFQRTGVNWSLASKLTLPNGQTSGEFGDKLFLKGNYLVAGSEYDDIGGNSNQGSVFVFNKTNNIWAFETKLTGSNGYGHDHFGKSVSIENDKIIIGAPFFGSQDLGRIYFYTRNNSIWEEQFIINGSSNSIGLALAASFDFLIAGKTNQTCMIYKKVNNIWIENTQIMPSIYTEDFGSLSVSISGNHILVGDPKNLSSTNFGAAYFYKRQ